MIAACFLMRLQAMCMYGGSGGPGCGKGTQCERIVRDFGFLHLSAGDLLREEVKKGSEVGRMCEQLMKDGKLVAVEVTLKLLKKAMKEGRKKAKGFLIDGFPRAIDQAQAFEKKVEPSSLVELDSVQHMFCKIKPLMFMLVNICYSNQDVIIYIQLDAQVGRPKLVIFLDCPKEEMEKRLLKRGETSGRSDDNAATIIKRFDTFQRESLPVIDFYNKLAPGLVLSVLISHRFSNTFA